MHTHDKSVGEIKAIQERIATTNKISLASVPTSVAVQYRAGCLYTGFQDYDGNWSKLDRWGKEFVQSNPGSKFHLEVDEEGRFRRMFVGIGSAARVAKKTGIEFSGIDATFFRHVKYKGRALILVTRDGNNQILLIAWVIASQENSVNYVYMAEKIKEWGGVEEYLNRPQQLMYSDRHKGIPAFETQFTCGTANCIVHIADNAEEWVRKKAGAQVSNMLITSVHLPTSVHTTYTQHTHKQAASFDKDHIHRIQKCTTREDYQRELDLFKRGYPEAAFYLDTKCDHSKTFLYSILEQGYTTHGHNTSNIVEIMNNIIRKARYRDPYHLIDFMLKWHGRKLAERQDIGTKLKEKKRLLTIYGHTMLGIRENIAYEERLKAQEQGDGKYLVIHESDEGTTERYHVDLKNKTCSCPFLRTHRIPCEHVIVVLDNLDCRGTPDQWDTFRKEWIAPYFWSENYIDAYEHEFVKTPHWGGSDKMELAEGERLVTKPLMKKNEKRNATKRKSKGEGGRRSRARFDPVAYRRRKRNGRPGPFNPFVHISDPTIFHKKPCGRKPLTYKQRSEGSTRAKKRLLEVIKEREKKKKRVRRPTRGASQVSVPLVPSLDPTIPVVSTPHIPTSNSSEIPFPSIPIISTPHIPTNGSSDIPFPSIPIITTPIGFPNFDLSPYLSSPMIMPYSLTSQPGSGYPLILPKL